MMNFKKTCFIALLISAAFSNSGMAQVEPPEQPLVPCRLYCSGMDILEDCEEAAAEMCTEPTYSHCSSITIFLPQPIGAYESIVCAGD